jgi:hypothetical protein
LNEIKQEYGIDMTLYGRLLRNIQYDYRKQTKDFTQFMDELPPKLKVDLIMHMYRKRYSTIKFFNRKDECFIAWITPLLKAAYY